jgi:hypothetical protein
MVFMWARMIRQRRLARQVMGPQAIVGVSVSTMSELESSPIWHPCDYMGTGPNLSYRRPRPMQKAVHGLSGLRDIVNRSPVPAVAIGGIGPDNAPWIVLPMALPVSPSSAVLPGPPTPSKPLRPWLPPAESAPGGDGDGWASAMLDIHGLCLAAEARIRPYIRQTPWNRP